MFKKEFLIFVFLLGFVLPSFSSSLKLGYDSNVLKYSDAEDVISSNLIQLGFSYNKKLDIIDRKTRMGVDLKKTIYNLSEKSNYSFGLKFKQPLGDYKYLVFSYKYIDNIYLREYVDVDQGVLDFVYNGTGCSFDYTKLNFEYERPIVNKKSKVNFKLIYETQFYNKFFTEFDLEIEGLQFKYSDQFNQHKYSLSISSMNATNLTLNDYTLSTSYMDRGYDEIELSVAYRYNKTGFSYKIFKRSYVSNIVEDQLHLNRNHEELQYSLWRIFNLNGIKNKLVFKTRKRSTTSPYTWVEILKTFDKYNIEHNIYF